MTHYYLADRSGYGRFPLRVLEAFDSRTALMDRMTGLMVEANDYDEGLNYLSSATHIVCSDMSVAVGKCLPADRCKASDLRTGPGSAEGLPVMRAFAARLDRLNDWGAPAVTEADEAEARRDMDAIAREPRGRHGWR